jgi:glycosyltransferase involved in cell wall biosynthesis
LLGSTLTYSIIALLLRIPLVATLHGKVDVDPKERLIYLKNLIMRLGVKRLITVSRDLAEYVEARGLFNTSDIRVIYNGVDIDKYSKNSLTDVRRQLLLDDKAILIGSVGNIRPAKAYHILIEAAATVINNNPLVHFVIAGHKKPELMAQLDDQINRAGIASNIHFIGFQQDSAAFLGQMDLFALSSSSEGFSISTIEAMATGLTVIVTRCGGPEEIVSHGNNGYMVPANDAGALAKGIIDLLNDDDLRKRLSNNGQSHARATFAMTTLLRSYQNEYLSLLP